MTNSDEKKDVTESEQANIDLVMKLFEKVWNEKQVEKIYEYMSPSVTFHHEKNELKGPEVWKTRFFETITQAIPDIRIEKEDVIAKGDTVIVRWNLHGTFEGELYDVPPTGEKIKFSGMSWIKVNDNRVAEIWTNMTLSYLLRQLSTEVKKLRGILPLCSFCKKIRDDDGSWKPVDEYIYRYSEANVSHSICPDCVKSEYPDEYPWLVSDKEDE